MFAAVITAATDGLATHRHNTPKGCVRNLRVGAGVLERVLERPIYLRGYSMRSNLSILCTGQLLSGRMFTGGTFC